MEYMIVYRKDEVYKLRFKCETDELLYLEPHPSAYVFHPIIGWEYGRVMTWLEERGFEYYWESDHD